MKRSRCDVRSFLSGQLVAYCEQVKTGSRVAAQLAVPTEYAQTMQSLAKLEGCRVKTKKMTAGRVSIWVYQHRAVARLIDALDAHPCGHVGIWSAGKLFGYSDHEVLRFLTRGV